MNVVHYWLTNFVPKENSSKKKSDLITTNEIIQKHQKIINFSENVENLYTYIALVQFASNTIMICSLAFLIVGVSTELKLEHCVYAIRIIAAPYCGFAVTRRDYFN